MSKLQKYNRIAFAIISVPTFITMSIFAFMMVCQVLPERHAKYDQNNGVISQDKAAKNAKEKEYNQYISYKNMYVLDNESQEFVIPVIARTMEKPEPYTERFRLNEAVVDEVIFDDSDNSSSFSIDGENKPEKKPDTTYLKVFSNELFVNLVYEKSIEKIHKTLINERFTGWELNYIRIGKKRYLAYIGTRVDSNEDGFLNYDDNSDFYLYDIDSQETKVVKIPDMKIKHYYLIRNNPILIFEVMNLKSPKSHKYERFFYRYNINTGKLEDIIPEEEKQLHLKLIMQ